MAKSVLPLAATGTGLTLFLTSDYIVQVAGIIIGMLGLMVALWRCWEIKRSNDFNKFKWEEENAFNTSKEKAENLSKEKADGSMQKEDPS